MPRGVYPRKTVAIDPFSTQPAATEPDDDVIHPVEGNSSACPGPLCPECFSDGWPSDATSAGCAHGMWIRKPPQVSAAQDVDF